MRNNRSAAETRRRSECRTHGARYERTLPEMSIVAAAACDAILENHYRLGGRCCCCSVPRSLRCSPFGRSVPARRCCCSVAVLRQHLPRARRCCCCTYHPAARVHYFAGSTPKPRRRSCARALHRREPLGFRNPYSVFFSSLSHHYLSHSLALTYRTAFSVYIIITPANCIARSTHVASYLFH